MPVPLIPLRWFRFGLVFCRETVYPLFHAVSDHALG